MSYKKAKHETQYIRALSAFSNKRSPAVTVACERRQGGAQRWLRRLKRYMFVLTGDRGSEKRQPPVVTAYSGP